MIINNDCLDEMRKMEANSVSCIVTDPPYGLHFMGKDWDQYSKGKKVIGRKAPGAQSNSEAHDVARYDETRNDEFQSFIYEFGIEALRIVKPGGHILMFGAPRRYHRQTCGLEDAGWEIRDCLMWLFGSGFPKSHNHFGIEGYGTALKPAYEPIIFASKPYEISHLFAIILLDLTNEVYSCQKSNYNAGDVDLNLRDSLALLNKELPFSVQEDVKTFAWEKLADASYVAKNTTEPEQGCVLANLSFVPDLVNTSGCEENPLANLILRGGADAIFANIQDIYMSVITKDTSENIGLLWKNTLEDVLREMSKFTTGMALRLITELRILRSCLSPTISKDTGSFSPNYEPIIMAMKPCDGTFKENAGTWGQAGINIDACRIGSDDTRSKCSMTALGQNSGWNSHENKEVIGGSTKGRWPANILFDEEAAALLDEQSGELSKAGNVRESNITKGESVFGIGELGKRNPKIGGDNGGGASRFFYCAKTSSRERNEGLDSFPVVQVTDGRSSGLSNGMPEKSMAPQKNHHPTVKPLKLMRYLITLVMPPKDGVLLDPFAGSGSTIVAAHQLGLKAIGIEKSADYCEIARKRIENASVIKKEENPQMDFLDGTTN